MMPINNDEFYQRSMAQVIAECLEISKSARSMGQFEQAVAAMQTAGNAAINSIVVPANVAVGTKDLPANKPAGEVKTPPANRPIAGLEPGMED